MSDFDFLKEFGKNMGRDRLHDQSATGWPSIAAGLDARDAAEMRRRRLLGWVFPLGMVASFLWLATAFWRSEGRANGLRNEVLTLKSSLENFMTSSDTVVRRVEIVRFDTVYRTVIVRRIVEDYRPAGGFSENDKAVAKGVLFENKEGGTGRAGTEILPKNMTGKLPENQPKTVGESPWTVSPKSGGAAVFIENKSQPGEKLPVSVGFNDRARPFGEIVDTARAATPPDFSTKKRLLETGPLPTKQPRAIAFSTKTNLPETGLAMLPAPPAGQTERVVRRLRSPDFQLGARAALLYPVTDRAAGNSFSVGMTVEKELSSRLSLVGGVDFGQLYFHVQPDKLADSGLPVPGSPSPDDVLKKASVGQAILDFSVGIRYSFLMNKRLWPYFSAAWVGEQANKQSLRYDFLNPLTEAASQVRIDGLANDFNARGGQFGVGADWHLHRWTVGASGFYQHQFRPSDAFLAERFGLRAVARYSF